VTRLDHAPLKDSPTRATAAEVWPAAVAGVLAAAVALAVACLVDALSGPVPSLVAVVDQFIIRNTPGNLVRFGIDQVGTADKPLLTLGTVIVGLGLGAVVGIYARRRRVVGDAVFVAGGVLGVLAAASVGTVSLMGATVAAALTVVAGAVTLRLLLTAADQDEAAAGHAPAGAEPVQPALPVAMPGVPTRRRFLVGGAVAGAGAAVLWAGAKGLSRGGPPAGQRASIRLPAPAEPVAAGTPGAADGLAADGLSPLITPTKDFYRIDEALVVPNINVDTWRLKIDGMVDNPYELSFDDLLAQPLIERDITLACVSNDVGGGLVGNARWLGVRLADVLERAQVDPRATQLVGRSVDGFTVGFPTAVAIDGRDAMVAVAQNGAPLTREHGFPARLIVPGLYGYVSATKWLREIELTTWEAFDAYWIQRGWAEQAPIKVQSRIDVPRGSGQVTPGRRPVAGVAWAPRRGIERVEFRLDRGPWQEARLGPSLGDDSWRQWAADWDATPGDHTLEVRATTGDGEVQTDVKVAPFPDGATGHHRVAVRVAEPK
jgi:DMSO/TMAO reductase YedYZ molybdopterin-dependent catalytic subunit